ncbi:MAG TPA: hypothetical protein VGP82_15865 [Ktedonobacterales bacterium]|jgi:hypothetical protein|nr:hypothetical protein [Ktedonobacterales bacterium]
MLDTQMLAAMWRAGTTAASDDIRDGMAYDQEYALEEAEAVAIVYGKTNHLPESAIRDLASEWLSGYKDAFAGELQWQAD